MSKRSRPKSSVRPRKSTPPQSTIDKVKKLIRDAPITGGVDEEEDARLEREIREEIRRQERPRGTPPGR
jgi:hypothetical protein